jgi:hypothetical protein
MGNFCFGRKTASYTGHMPENKPPFILRLLRGLAQTVLTLIFLLSIGLFFALAPLSTTLTRPDTIKRWVAQSGLYEDLLPSIIEQAASGGVRPEKPQQEVENQLDPELIRTLFSQALPPDVLRGYVEPAIDGIYAWLRGETAQPEVTVDLSERRPAVAAAFADYVRAKLRGAPACTPAQMAGKVDPLAENCLPRGQTLDQVAKAAGAQLIAKDGPLGNPVIKSADFIENLRRQHAAEPDQSPDPQAVLDNGPRVYRQFVLAPWYLVAAILASAAGLILLSQERLRTGRRLAIKLAVSAGLVALSVFLLTRVFNNLLQRLTVSVAERDVNVTRALEPLYRTVIDELAQATYWFTLPALLLSATAIVVLTIILRKRANHYQAEHLPAAE